MGKKMEVSKIKIDRLGNELQLYAHTYVCTYIHLIKLETKV